MDRAEKKVASNSDDYSKADINGAQCSFRRCKISFYPENRQDANFEEFGDMGSTGGLVLGRFRMESD